MNTIPSPTSKAPLFEKPTDELRQVTTSARNLNHNALGYSYIADSPTVVLKVQRKWLVQDGDEHFDEIPEKERQHEWLPDNQDHEVWSDRGDGRLGRFVYLKEEWRDLPIVTVGKEEN